MCIHVGTANRGRRLVALAIGPAKLALSTNAGVGNDIVGPNARSGFAFSANRWRIPANRFRETVVPHPDQREESRCDNGGPDW